jgi:hypothetical protein
MDQCQGSFAKVECRLDGFERACPLCFLHADAILDHQHHRRQALAGECLWLISAIGFAKNGDAQETLAFQEFEEISSLRFRRRRHTKGDKHAGAGPCREQFVRNRLRRLGSHLGIALGTPARRHPWEEQLQVVVDFSDRADR